VAEVIAVGQSAPHPPAVPSRALGNGSAAPGHGASAWRRRTPLVVWIAIAALFAEGATFSGMRRQVADWSESILGVEVSLGVAAMLLLLVPVVATLAGRHLPPTERWWRAAMLIAYVGIAVGMLDIALGTAGPRPIQGLLVFLPLAVTLLVWYACGTTENRATLFACAAYLLLVYLVVNLIYWAVFLDPLSNPTQGLPYRRMGGALATVVHLGFLIPAALAFSLQLDASTGRARLWRALLYVLIAVIAAIATGSRSGLVLVIPLATFALVTSFTGRRQSLGVIGVAAAPILVAIALIFDDLTLGTRFSYFGGGGRTESWIAALRFLEASDFADFMLGAGWGEIYPYWDWLRAGGHTWRNTFMLDGRHTLVSPHNSILWIAAEGGFVQAFAILLVLAILLARLFRPNSGDAYGWLGLYGAMAIVGMMLMADVLISDPHTAFLCWVLLAFAAGGRRPPGGHAPSPLCAGPGGAGGRSCLTEYE
jgi:O-antigen ligase